MTNNQAIQEYSHKHVNDSRFNIESEVMRVGATKNGTTACGLNNEGVLVQDCTDGAWVDSSSCTGTHVCVNGDTQNGSTTCGLNGEGVLIQDCTSGGWVDSANCTGTHVCVNGDTQNGTTLCGFNNEGVLIQDCTNGAWVDSASCTGTHVCVNGGTQNGTTLCGFNNEGVLIQDCTRGAWVDSASCTGTHVCVNGNTQNGTTLCGFNNEGVFVQDCTSGAWVDSANCTGTDVCENTTQQNGSTVCGFNNEGVYVQDCTSGAWVDSANCTGTDVCENTTQQNGSTVCGFNNEGVYVQDCTNGAWVDSANCTGTDICTNGNVQNGATACGLNNEGIYVQDCTSGAWVDSANCTGTDICTNGSTQPGANPCGLSNQGVYQQSCSSGAWGETAVCVGQVVRNYLKAYGSDRWKVEATSGVPLTITMEGKNLGNLGFSWGSPSEAYVDIFKPDGSSVLLDKELYTSSGGSVPYTFTPTETGIYVIYAHSYLNSTGGYELNITENALMQPLARITLPVEPSESPLTFFMPGTPTEDWTHTASGDLVSPSKGFETWEFEGLTDQNLKIDMGMVSPYPKDRTDLVESYLYLFDASGNLIASDDDSGPGKSARIYHTLTSDGTYRIVATTYGYYNSRNWTNREPAAGWGLGGSGIGYYDLTVVAKSTMDFVKQDLPLTNPNAIKINAIVVTDDAAHTTLLIDQAGLESMVSALNTDLATLYPLTNWPGFELAAITKFFEPNYFFTPAPHEALAEMGNSPAALQNYVNLIILDVDNSQTGIVGTTNLKGNILGPRGATLVVEYNAGSGVFIHEMGHVFGVQHLAGSWPPKNMDLTRADGTKFGYWTFDHSNPERSYMSNWDSTCYDTDFSSKSWYLTKESSSLNSSTHGHLFAEALRTWLVDNNIIDSNAPSTSYAGPSTGDGIASGYWNWDANSVLLQNNGVPAEGIFPTVATSSSAGNQSGAAIWQASSGSSVLLRYRTGAGTWNDSQTFNTVSNKSVEGERIAMDASGNAVAIWGGSWDIGIEVSFHGKNDTTWQTPDVISTASGTGAKTRQPSIAINDAGEVAAIWVSREDSSSNWRILLRERATNGTWSAPAVLYDGSSLAAFPELAFNNDGDIFAVWQEIVGDVFVVRGRYRNGDNDAWTAEESYSTGLNHAGFAQPAIDSTGNGLVYWREADIPQDGWTLAESGHVSARSRSSAGVVSSVEQLSPDAADAFHTAVEIRTNTIAFTPGGGAMATWSGFDGSDFRIYVALMNASGTWGSPEAISAAGQNAKLPRIAVGENGILAVSWQRSDGFKSRIQASVYDPATSQWSTALSLSPAGESAFWSSISFDGGGKFTALWSRFDGSNYKLESKQATMALP